MKNQARSEDCLPLGNRIVRKQESMKKFVLESELLKTLPSNCMSNSQDSITKEEIPLPPKVCIDKIEAPTEFKYLLVQFVN